LDSPYTTYSSGTAAITSSTPAVFSFYFNSYVPDVVTDYTVSIPSLSLSSGTYYLNIYNPQVSNGNNTDVYWVGYDSGTSIQPYNDGTRWMDGEGSFPFSVRGTPDVPEPSTYGLIGIGALAFALAARRRKLKTA
jgi:hypothetical protein